MKRVLGSLGVAACGLITSVLTAIAILVVERLVGINLFTLMVWFVLPVGAGLAGAAAASGYYFGSLYFHRRPGFLLFVQMVLIAAFTQWLIYYMGYVTLVLDDGRRLSDYMSFSDYLDFRLTKAQYKVGRAQRPTGEMGETGYWIAGVQLIGFLIGGFATFVLLWERPLCRKCKRYYRPLSSVEKIFASRGEFSNYYDGLFQIPVDAPQFAEAIRMKPGKSSVYDGTISIKSSLLGCPECKQQLIADKVQVYNGREWKDVSELKRETLIPDGVNLVSVFRRK